MRRLEFVALIGLPSREASATCQAHQEALFIAPESHRTTELETGELS